MSTCKDCGHFLEADERGLEGRCFVLERDAAEGLLQLGTVRQCKIRVYRDADAITCDAFLDQSPGAIMQDIIDRERKEAKWL